MGKKIELKYYNAIFLKAGTVPQLGLTNKDKYFSPVNAGVPWRAGAFSYSMGSDYQYVPNFFDFRVGDYAVIKDDSFSNIFGLNLNYNPTNGYFWIVEDSRIRGGFNNTIMDPAPRAFLIEKENKVRQRENTMIYSGVFNSRTGVNESNVFNASQDITTSVDKNLGSIQKLFALDNSLTIFQENKVSQAMIDKDAIYTQEGQPLSAKSNIVIGAVTPYVGDYGISRNPESFASFGFRRYFADKDRNAIMRLSRDGLTPISQYGMKDYFRDTLSKVRDEYIEYTSPRFLIIEEQPPYPWNSQVLPEAFYITIAPDFTDSGDFSLVEHGARISYYIPGGKPKNDVTIVNAGSGYNNTDSYTFIGGDGTGVTGVFTVDGTGGITGVSFDTTDADGYKINDILTVVSVDPNGNPLPGSNGEIKIESVLDTGSGTWFDIAEGYVTGLIYDGNDPNVPSKIISTVVGFGVDGVRATKVRFKTLRKEEIVGSYDVYKDNYVLSINRASGSKITDEISDYTTDGVNSWYSTITFDETPKGWTTFYSYRPFRAFSLKNTYYTVKENQLYSQYTNSIHNSFYNVTSPSSIKFLFNQNPSMVKNFKTINYEGSNGWQVETIESGAQGPNPSGINVTDEAELIRSHVEGAYVEKGITYYTGFKVKENKYFANINSKSPAVQGQILGGPSMTGVKGFYVEVKMSTDQSTEPGGMKELFSVGTEVVASSK